MKAKLFRNRLFWEGRTLLFGDRGSALVVALLVGNGTDPEYGAVCIHQLVVPFKRTYDLRKGRRIVEFLVKKAIRESDEGAIFERGWNREWRGYDGGKSRSSEGGK